MASFLIPGKLYKYHFVFWECGVKMLKLPVPEMSGTARRKFLSSSFLWRNVRGPIEKFVDSPYYSESKLCGGAVTVSFSKYLPWQAMHFLQHSTHSSKQRAADRSSLRNFLPRSSLFMVGKEQKSHGTRSELNSVFGLDKVDRWNPIKTSSIQSRSRPMQFWAFPTVKRELRGKKFRSDERSAARFRELDGAL
jgi:hypothetical protein